MKFKQLEQRRGYIKISFALIQDNPKGVMQILSKLLVIRAENDFMSNSVKYWAYCKYFEPIEKGIIEPQYDCIVTTEKGKTKSIEFRKVEN